MHTTTSLADNIARIRQRIDDACTAVGRSDAVTLEIAAKTRTPAECQAAARALAAANLPVLLGHNRVQEARETASAIKEVAGARLHLIGPLQTNKINHALAVVDCIETIDSVALVDAVDKRATRPLPVYLQVNTSGEASKHGCAPADALVVAEAIAASARLQLAGLMTVGLNSMVEADVRASYAQLHALRALLAGRLDLAEETLELSMGMSRDLEWAIAEGATLVRVGTDVFGPRN
ncbi:YggS family pyridoxal phosphate-dependent enzyme [Schaalia sp. Marseille-Q2122]|uniref:YggS family pyridoxal phosphate-dependent enzyme n=1 Tax=Schaalia sp. Marseille-Q2122 TaxID=2736604 RepID=UPI00158C8608|nr:YggS family pyridoxal phosphate-dependent enzyme [Schaalia sp. Marseille-Q2122]